MPYPSLSRRVLSVAETLRARDAGTLPDLIAAGLLPAMAGGDRSYGYGATGGTPPAGGQRSASVEDMRDERAEILDWMDELNHRALSEKRDLTDDEDAEYRAKERRFNQLTRKIDEHERRHGRPGMTRSAALRDGREGDAPNGVTLGKEERAVDWARARNDRLQQRSGFSVEDASEFCLGNVMRAMVDADFRDALTDVERRALVEGTDSAGGFVTPEPLSAQVVDRIRNAMRVVQAGATTVPLESDKQAVPRLTAGATGGWRNEGAAFTESDVTFDRINFTARYFGILTKLSEELFQDMVPGAGQVIENELAQACALELDRAALRGSGTPPEPRGIRNQSGVAVQSMGTNGAVPSTYAPLMTAVTTLLQANREPTAVLLSPRSSQEFAGLVDTTGQPLQPPKPIADLPFLVTGQIPNTLTQGTSNLASEAYVGYWPDLLIALRLGITLRLLQERYADTGQVAYRVGMRVDFQVAHPESFVVIAGIN